MCSIAVSSTSSWRTESSEGSDKYHDGIEDVPLPESLLLMVRFPLYPSAGDQQRFDYGVFLLNKDIEQVYIKQVMTNYS
jgi:hypothetical protein